MEEYLGKITNWEDLPKELQNEFGKTHPKDYIAWKHKLLEYHSNNYLEFQGLQHIDFYKDLLLHLRINFREYPYHLLAPLLSNYFPSPFSYYLDMLCDSLRLSKPFGAIPYYTTRDMTRITGVNDSKYQDLLKRCRERGALSRISKSIRSLLPKEPVEIKVETWWSIVPVLSKIKNLKKEDLSCLQKLCDGDQGAPLTLFKKEALEFEIEVYDNDVFEGLEEGEGELGRVSKHTGNPKLISQHSGIPLNKTKAYISFLCRIGAMRKLEPKFSPFTTQEVVDFSVEESIITPNDSVINYESSKFAKEVFGKSSDLTVTLAVGLELCSFLEQNLKVSVNTLVNEGLFGKQLFDLQEKLKLEDSPVLSCLEVVLDALIDKNLEVRGTSQTEGCGMILCKGEKEPVIFTELPNSESFIYRMFKYQNSRKANLTALFYKGEVLKMLPRKLQGSACYLLQAEEYLVCSASEVVTRANSLLPHSCVYITCIDSEDFQTIKVPLPLEASKFSFNLKKFLEELNQTEELNYTIGYLEIGCLDKNRYFLLNQVHGIPIEDLEVVTGIFKNLKKKDWFVEGQLDLVIESQQNEVFRFREFMCKIENNHNLVFDGNIVKIK